MTPTIVSGAISTLTDLERDEAWLQGWFREQPTRLGLGDLSADATDEAGGAPDATFMATLEERCFSVDVQLGELDASHGFAVLDAWARNRARTPDRDHVAVLVTETVGDRYRTTLETLTKHLPLVVVELAVWRGENEALIVPSVTLASEDVDLGSAPALSAASAMARVMAASAPAPKDADTSESGTDEPEADGAADASTGKDDTGVADPWGLPPKEPEAAAAATSTSNGSRLLTRFNT
jgi:hypothetical protein